MHVVDAIYDGVLVVLNCLRLRCVGLGVFTSVPPSHNLRFKRYIYSLFFGLEELTTNTRVRCRVLDGLLVRPNFKGITGISKPISISLCV